ncbi:MAG: c-type cytochrome [Sulfuricurvum sp.]|nr:c-type cytochrome [Sulfuricurvum sp.]MDD5386034.1 c-type cytochrome [Sulfuricurvum sp.]
MYKLDRKLILSASAIAAAMLLSAVSANGATETKSTAKPSIDGGVYYPVVNGKTGPYSVNTKAIGKKLNHGRVPTANELKAWNTDVMPDGTGLPEGSGSASDGSDIYDAKCVMCHGDFGSGGAGYPSLTKGNAYTLKGSLKSQRSQDGAEGPVRVFGTYWPRASSLWWYIKDAMPHQSTGTLTVDETYALTAYILQLNEIKIDNILVDSDYVLDRAKFLKISMPNKDGFEPNIDGPKSLPGIRAYYAKASNFGGQKVKPSERCMTNCQKPTAKIVRIQNGGIKEFVPPMATARDLPKEEAKGFDAKTAYEVNCAACHANSSMGAPAIGDKKAWATVTQKGMEAVYKNGNNGINGMPAKGGSSLSDADFKTVVDYIVNTSK